MTEHEKDKFLDELLDSGLSAYSSAEPRPGLETRILANLREVETGKASSWHKFTWLRVGVAVSAAILVLAPWIGRRHQTAPVNNMVQTQPSAPPKPRVQQTTPAVPHHMANQEPRSHIQLHPRNAELALNQRPPIFPTPVALSEQEKLMFAFLANTPREVVIAQLQRDDQKEAQAFWEAQPFTALQRSGNTR